MLGTLPSSIIFQNDNGGSIWLMTVFSQFNSLGLMLHSPAQEKVCPSPALGHSHCVVSSAAQILLPALTNSLSSWLVPALLISRICFTAAFCPFSARLSAPQHLFPHLTLLSHLGQEKLVPISPGPSAQRKHLSFNSFETRPPRSAFQSVFLSKLWRKNI